MSSVLDWEATPNPVKENRAGNIGKAVDRYEGPLKVTGTAPYAYEVVPPSPPAYGVLVSAPIARGRITAVDTAAAREVGEGVDVRTGVAAGRDQLVGAGGPVRADRVAMAAEQGHPEVGVAGSDRGGRLQHPAEVVGPIGGDAHRPRVCSPRSGRICEFSSGPAAGPFISRVAASRRSSSIRLE